MVLLAACLAACLALRPVSASAAPAEAGMADNRTEAVPPSQDPFYREPDGLDGFRPGTILRHRRTPDAIAVFQETAERYVEESWQMLYRTTDHRGRATVTAATVLVPPRADRSKLLSFQVSADSPSGDCVPSFGFQRSSGAYPRLYSETMQMQALLVEAALSRGWLVVVPDADGQKGAWPSVGLASSAVLDGIRAAKASAAFTRIGADPTVALWGYSWGGAVSLGALGLQPAYAPDVAIAGAALGGAGNGMNREAAVFNYSLRHNKDIYAGYLPVYLLGLAAQVDGIKELIEAHVRPQYRDHIYLAGGQCIEANGRTYRNEDIVGMFDDPHFFQTVLRKVKLPAVNLTLPPKAPLFWYQWAHEAVTAEVSRDVQDFCSKGATIEYQLETSPNIRHDICAFTRAPAALRWLDGIMAGRPPRPGCSNSSFLFKGAADPDFAALYSPHLQFRLGQYLRREEGYFDRQELQAVNSSRTSMTGTGH
ncbi:hypothetical protein CDD83_7652 [Cordyceps sp. RAO-2017]|nr:hypothetical protein CDD83_7652 [Cordyceps sp. RAO-2017]